MTSSCWYYGENSRAWATEGRGHIVMPEETSACPLRPSLLMSLAVHQNPCGLSLLAQALGSSLAPGAIQLGLAVTFVTLARDLSMW